MNPSQAKAGMANSAAAAQNLQPLQMQLCQRQGPSSQLLPDLTWHPPNRRSSPARKAHHTCSGARFGHAGAPGDVLRLLADVVAQDARALLGAQLQNGLGLDLADALPGHL